MKVDPEVLEEYGLLLLKIKLFPYFDMAHYFLMCLAVREDIHQYQTCIFDCFINDLTFKTIY